MLNGIGSIKARELISSFDTVEEIFVEKPIQLSKKTGFNRSIIQKMEREKALEKSEIIIQSLQQNSVTPIYIDDSSYPHRLRNCVDAPVLLYKKGTIDLNPPKAIAIVGTRSATSYGTEICRELVKSFQGENVVIVSGLAHGIDATIHRYCLKYGVPTLAVLGHGLDRIYPAVHRELASKMLLDGGLLSEFVPGTTPDRENFPKRNRIVAGMTDATIVIESKKRGGSLITANLANDYNRDVFAFPGSVHMETSQGCNHLIANQKAHLIQSSSDFHRMMGWEKKKVDKGVQRQLFQTLTEVQKEIVKHISAEKKIQIDILSVKASISISRLNQELFSLEMDGVVRSLPGKMYSIA
ncbi:MAG: DNA-protecting protein DprA [Fluviicola sp.]|nr:DNA-protecting protein DprA [Fluviicola sp.]